MIRRASRALCACSLLFSLLLGAASLGAPASPALAQDEDPEESRATSFEAVEGNAREEVAGGPLLLGAYATVWLILIGYAGYMGLIHQRTERKLTELRRIVEAKKDREHDSE